MSKSTMFRLFLFLILFIPALAFPAGFSCKKASTKIEKMICNDASLSLADEALSRLYKQIYGYSIDKAGLRNSQLTWIKQRDSKCKTSQTACLNSYVERINWLTLRQKSPMMIQLDDGMTYPNSSALDKKSINALKHGNYKPWPRRALTSDGHSRTGNIYISFINNFQVAYVDGDVYLFYQNYKKLSEYDVKRKMEYVIDNNVSDEQQPSILKVVGHRLYYSTRALPYDETHNKINLNAMKLMSYDIGSHQSSHDVFSTELSNVISHLDLSYELYFDEGFGYEGDNETRYAISDNGQWLAGLRPQTVASCCHVGLGGTLTKFISYYNKKLKKNITAGDQSPDLFLFNQKSGRYYHYPIKAHHADWTITAIVPNQHKPIVYFDNSGVPRACIWEIDFRKTHNQLTKIVPEHEAKMPRAVTIDGHDYLFYVFKNQIFVARDPKS